MNRIGRTVWFEAAGRAALRSEPLPSVGEGEVLVRALASGISAGTERIVLRGDVPPAIAGAMTLPSMRGTFSFPIAYGYAVVGAIEGGAGEPGQRVFALHPHADWFVCPAAHLRPVPEDVPAARAVLAANLETAINVVWDTGAALGDRAVVTGLGVVGLLVARLLLRSGARVTAVDPDADRRALARELGVDAADALDAHAAARADVFVEASSSPEVLAALVDVAPAECTIVVASWYGARAATLALGGAFHPNRVTIRSSQVAGITPAKRGRWDAARRWALVGELLGDARLDALLADATPLSEAPALYAELHAGVRWTPPQRVLDPAR